MSAVSPSHSRLQDARFHAKSNAPWNESRTDFWKFSANPSCYRKWITPAARLCMRQSVSALQYISDFTNFLIYEIGSAPIWLQRWCQRARFSKFTFDSLWRTCCKRRRGLCHTPFLSCTLTRYLSVPSNHLQRHWDQSHALRLAYRACHSYDKGIETWRK